MERRTPLQTRRRTEEARTFLSSPRNRKALDCLRELGFELEGFVGAGASFWTLSTDRSIVLRLGTQSLGLRTRLGGRRIHWTDGSAFAHYALRSGRDVELRDSLASHRSAVERLGGGSPFQGLPQLLSEDQRADRQETSNAVAVRIYGFIVLVVGLLALGVIHPMIPLGSLVLFAHVLFFPVTRAAFVDFLGGRPLTELGVGGRTYVLLREESERRGVGPALRVCPGCSQRIEVGSDQVLCGACGTFSHRTCHVGEGCRSEACAAPVQISLSEQEGALRCPFCRDDISAGAELAVCAGCGVQQHDACWSEHGACSVCRSPARRRQAA